MQKTAKPKPRDFALEAAEELESLVKSHPALSHSELFDIAMEREGKVQDWVESRAEHFRQREFANLFRYSVATTPEGKKVRMLLSYTKFVQTENGDLKQRRLWKYLPDMTYEEVLDGMKLLQGNLAGGVESFNDIGRMWHSFHPDEPAPPQLRLVFGDGDSAACAGAP